PPPVALLVYAPDQPRRAVYYPFARFSPEWQALHFGLTNGIPLRFMDLTQAHQLARVLSSEFSVLNQEPDSTTSADEAEADAQHLKLNTQNSELSPRADPLGWLAQAAGYSDGE